MGTQILFGIQLHVSYKALYLHLQCPIHLGH